MILERPWPCLRGWSRILSVVREAAMCVEVQWVGRATNNRITHIGGSTQDHVPWGLTAAEAISRIQSDEWSFFVEVAGMRTAVRVGSRDGDHFLTTYLTTHPDPTALNNLHNLPSNPRPFGGVEPHFPWSLPGIHTVINRSRVTAFQYANDHALHDIWIVATRSSEGWSEIYPTDFFWSLNSPPWMYIDVLVPFPTHIRMEA